MTDHASEVDSRPCLEIRRGCLVLVATPIGNLQDVSERVRRSLESSAVVACEDTRRTGSLMAHLGLDNRLLSVHEHNESRRVPELLERLDRGETVSLVSDAGTPLVSDPGYRLVQAAVAGGHEVIAVPGPAAFLAALIVSALPPTPFTFVGFPPPKSSKRRRFFERLATLDHTVVLYESPHRISRTLEQAMACAGDRLASLSRELTKMHEETIRGRLSELVAIDRERGSWKGELVLVLGPPSE